MMNEWACTCPARKLPRPMPDQWAKMCRGAMGVTVQRGHKDQTGAQFFTTWTDEDSKYTTVHGNYGTGWCKHQIACAIYTNELAISLARALIDLYDEVVEARTDALKVRVANIQNKGE